MSAQVTQLLNLQHFYVMTHTGFVKTVLSSNPHASVHIGALRFAVIRQLQATAASSTGFCSNNALKQAAWIMILCMQHIVLMAC